MEQERQNSETKTKITPDISEMQIENGSDVKLQRISTINSQEVNSKVAPVGNGVYESQETNGSTNVLVQPNLQLSKGIDRKSGKFHVK